VANRYISFDELKKIRPYNQKRVNKLTQQMINESNAMRLAEVRKTMKLSQAALAKKIGVNQSKISRIERGKFSNTEIGTLQSYIEALGGKLEIYARIGKDMHRLVDSDKY
jgi:DNA-binding XRE family transcriptional regulator